MIEFKPTAKEILTDFTILTYDLSYSSVPKEQIIDKWCKKYAGTTELEIDQSALSSLEMSVLVKEQRAKWREELGVIKWMVFAVGSFKTDEEALFHIGKKLQLKKLTLSHGSKNLDRIAGLLNNLSVLPLEELRFNHYKINLDTLNRPADYFESTCKELISALENSYLLVFEAQFISNKYPELQATIDSIIEAKREPFMPAMLQAHANKLVDALDNVVDMPLDVSKSISGYLGWDDFSLHGVSPNEALTAMESKKGQKRKEPSKNEDVKMMDSIGVKHQKLEIEDNKTARKIRRRK